jgi:hypothetical protein
MATILLGIGGIWGVSAERGASVERRLPSWVEKHRVGAIFSKKEERMKPNWTMNLSLPTIGAFLFGLMLLAATPVSLAQDAIDEDAQKVLQGMSAYIGGLEAFSTQTEIDFEVVDIEGQKLQFISSGALSVQRPGRLHVTRVRHCPSSNKMEQPAA